MTRHDVAELYKLPKDVKFCRKCTISNQRPRIKFDDNGVCSACNFAEYKQANVDWNKREEELVALCDRFRRNDGRYDVIVPCSGGKDSAFVAHQLKFRYGMNPLTVTSAPLLYTDIGRANLEAMIASGLDNLKVTTNGTITRKLVALCFEHMGDPFQPFVYGATNLPLQISARFDIPLLMYGENGEVEYGGDMKNAFKPTRDIGDHDKHYFSGKPPDFWSQFGISEADLKPFMAPPVEELRKVGTEIHFYGYYKFWDPQENFYYCQEHTGFMPNPERSQGTYSKYASLDDKLDGFHYFLGFIKFGIGRATSDASHEVRDGKITREEAVALVRRFDSEFPAKYFSEFLEYCSITEAQFWDVVDSWRSDTVWERDGKEWRLKTSVWQHEGNGNG
jgi:N-acetyl sugar amidotransferase